VGSKCLGDLSVGVTGSQIGVKQIIFASSGSVYGVQDAPNVTEDLELVPISAYNKTKMIAERVLLSFQDDLAVHCIRPATVCGLSPSMRLDVSVNLLTHQACTRKQITLLGGSQTRPNIHIQDIVSVFEHFLQNPQISSGTYNAGFENLSLQSVAELISEKTGAGISIAPSNDPRSYRQDSTKLLATGFTPHRCVAEAVDEMVLAFNAEPASYSNDESHRVPALQKALGGSVSSSSPERLP